MHIRLACLWQAMGYCSGATVEAGIGCQQWYPYGAYQMLLFTLVMQV
jgi:hypothetical protein